MSLLAATQIPKPADEQAFERASVILWRGLLNDPNVQRNGRRGQRQNGVDLFGVRDRNPAHQVGIQCKLKGDGQVLTETEVRAELAKALTFKPALREYFITTTAPDDVALQELARQLSAEQAANGRTILIYVWGWNTLEERISEDANARKEFDPDYGPFSERILERAETIAILQEETRHEMGGRFSGVEASIARIESSLLKRLPGDATSSSDAIELHLDAEIDAYRSIANQGKPLTAKPLLEALLARVLDTASGRILFRVKANIGACLFALGDDMGAAELLSEAFEHAPTEPKAIANKAFSLLLEGNWRELLRFGAEELERDPANDGLAGYVVQAARFDPSIDDPLPLVPKALHDTAAVSIGHVDFLRHRKRVPDWWLAAREALAAHPEDQTARQFAAEADLDQLLQDDRFQRTQIFAPGDRDRVQAAANVLQNLWDQLQSSERVVRPERAALCCNLVLAHHTLSDFGSAIVVARQGLSLTPDDSDLLTRAALVAIDGHDDDLVEHALSRLPAGPDSLILSFRYYVQHGDWPQIAKLYREQAVHIPEVERSLISATGRLAEAKLSSDTNMAEVLKDIAHETRDDPRASIIVADFARMSDFEDIAEAAFEEALALIDDASHVAGRLMVAMYAARVGKWAVVADLLDGHVAEDRDSEELRTLAQALVNDSPIRQRALRFFARLPQELADIPFFRHAEGLLHFNRGALQQAEDSLRRAIEGDPTLSSYLALLATLRRRERQVEIRSLLEALNPRALQGSPGQKMYLAHEMHAAGLIEQSYHFAYDVLREARNDPDAALRYVSLMMIDPRGRSIPRVNRVGVDVWVRLRGEGGETYSFIIEDGPDQQGDNIHSSIHPLAAAAKDLEVGDEFAMSTALGEEIRWRVIEVKHKYLHALHDVMENYQTRFPDVNGLYRMTMKEGDIQPALEHVKRISESNRKLADLYLVQHLPMSFVASKLGGDPIGFAEYIRSLKCDLQVCLGNEPERAAAAAIIKQYKTAGAVLDTYTAWTVASIGALDVLAAVFETVVVPQSVIDELRLLRDRDDWIGESSMSVGWHDGEFFRHEHTAEDVSQRKKVIEDSLRELGRFCRIEPVVAPDNPAEVLSYITDAFGSHLLDSANVAVMGRVLIAEDLYFRHLVSSAMNVRGVWLQAVFASAVNERIIDRKRYADLVIKLASRRHSHVSLDAMTLLAILEADETPGIVNFATTAQYIGAEKADMRSHLMVVDAFLKLLWGGDAAPSLRIQAATGILLRQLNRHIGTNWAMMLSALKVGAAAELVRYIDSWTVGHFLSIGQLRTAESRVAAVRRQAKARK